MAQNETDHFDSQTVKQAAMAIAQADALLIGAGAGMGVDSGLPDFRGNEGFWKAYPHFAHLGLSFTDLANPRWFYDDPAQAWGFYGHRYNLYRDTMPHQGFGLLRQWVAGKPQGGFVFTSNVDGHFQKAGFAEEHILECHGTINHWQCVEQCTDQIWPAEFAISVDQQVLKALGQLPACPACRGLARPNILMFGDFGWTPNRTDQQTVRYQQWLRTLQQQEARLVIIELGAGTAVPTVRYESEGRARRQSGQLIRINPRDTEAPRGSLVIPGGALAALQAIDNAMQG